MVAQDVTLVVVISAKFELELGYLSNKLSPFSSSSFANLHELWLHNTEVAAASTSKAAGTAATRRNGMMGIR